ncbi:MAG: hypothetical protein KAR40_09665 [Candidatus Sabulitectum sp.]|nr:hypothetical protein [Candidatus Sabulitectum sp.]
MLEEEVITEEDTPAEEGTPEGTPSGGEEEGTPVEGGEEEEVDSDDEKKFSQKDLNRIEAKNKGRDRRENRELRDRLARLEGRSEAGQVPAQEVTPQSSFNKPEPQEDAYETTAEYVKAVSDWQWEKRQTEHDAVSAATAQATAAGKLRSGFDDAVKASDIYERHPDFDEVLEDSGGVFYTDEMEELVLTSESSVDIVNHLARNLGEAEKIGRMTPIQAAQAIARLEVKLTKKPTKKSVSKAPTPINPVGGKGGEPNTDVSKMSMAELAKHRNNQDLGY